MIDATAACGRVESYLATVPREDDDPWIINHDRTEDHGFAWVFHWTLRSMLRRKNPPITGTYPIIVVKESGRMYICAGPYPPARYLSVLQTRPDEMSLFELPPAVTDL